MDPERTPVIVGVGRYTQRIQATIEESNTPISLFLRSARLAAADALNCGGPAAHNGAPGSPAADALLKDIVAIATPAQFLETRWQGAFNGERPFKNFPQRAAKSLNANPQPSLCWKSFPGGK